MLPHKKTKKRAKSQSPARPARPPTEGTGEGDGELIPESPTAPGRPPATPKSSKGSRTPRGRKRTKSPGDRKQSKSPGDRKQSKSPGGRKKSKSPGGRKKSKSPGSRKKSKSPGGRRKKSKSPRGRQRSRSRSGAKASAEPEPEPEPEPWRPRSDSQVPDYEGIHVTESLLPVRDEFLLVIDHLAQDERLKNYTSEFVRLYERVAAAHERKHELASGLERQADAAEEREQAVKALSQQLDAERARAAALERHAEELRAEVDAAHLREIDSKCMIDNLRQEVDHYQEQMRHHVAPAEENEAMVDYERLKKRIIQEKQEMAKNNLQLKKHLAEMYEQQGLLHHKNSAANLQVTNLSERLQQAMQEAHREMRLKEKLEEELECLVEERNEHAAQEAALDSAVRAGERTAVSLQQAVREQRAHADRLARDNEALSQRVQDERRAADRLRADLDKVRRDSQDKAAEILRQEGTINKLRADVHKARHSLDQVLGRLGLQQQKMRQAEEQREELTVSARAVARELDRTQRDAEQERREAAGLQKAKELLVSKVVRGEESFKQATNSLLVSERQCRSLEAELAQYASEAVKQRRLIAKLEQERELLHADKADLNKRLDVQRDQLRQAEEQILHLKRQVADAEKKIQAQVNVTEATVLERNKLEKLYEEARTARDDLKAQAQLMGASTEQLREALHALELDGKRLSHALDKAEGEKACATRDLNAAQLRGRELEAVIADQEKAEAALKRSLAQLESERDALRRQLRGVHNERDIIGTQLVRRNDELDLLLAKVDVLQALLTSGQEEYVQRLDDIRLLKLEVRKLRQEKVLLQRDVVAGADLRRELYHLSKDLAFEKQRRAALEAELKTPVNLHRWRRLEASDPASLELIHKVNLLQKRLLQQHSLLLAKERQLQDAEKLYLALRATVVKLPGPDVLVRLKKAQTALEQRARKIKSLFAELSMTEATVHDYRVDLNRVREELADFKSMYFTAKRKLDALGHSVGPFGAARAAKAQDQDRVEWKEDSLPPIETRGSRLRSVRMA